MSNFTGQPSQYGTDRSFCRRRQKSSSYDYERQRCASVATKARKRATSLRKPSCYKREHDIINDMRPRTSSMPSRNTFRKPSLQHTHQNCNNPEADADTYIVRAFETNSKGVILNRSDSVRSRSSNSVFSSEGDPQTLSESSRSSSIQSSVANLSSHLAYKIILGGHSGVGKTAIAQQFMTSEYLGGFNTSTDGETEKTVNVLLNGEETALAFVEQSELDETDEMSDNTAAYVIVYACDDKTSFDRAVDTLYNLRQKQHRDDVIFFVGNKSDLVRSRCVTSDEAKAVAMTYNCKFVETSVVLNVHVDELLVGIVKQLRLQSTEAGADKSPGCASTSLSLLNKIFKKDSLSKSCENLYA